MQGKKSSVSGLILGEITCSPPVSTSSHQHPPKEVAGRKYCVGQYHCDSISKKYRSITTYLFR